MYVDAEKFVAKMRARIETDFIMPQKGFIRNGNTRQTPIDPKKDFLNQSFPMAFLARLTSARVFKRLSKMSRRFLLLCQKQEKRYRGSPIRGLTEPMLGNHSPALLGADRLTFKFLLLRHGIRLV